jgi:hypothetical protein
VTLRYVDWKESGKGEREGKKRGGIHLMFFLRYEVVKEEEEDEESEVWHYCIT